MKSLSAMVLSLACAGALAQSAATPVPPLAAQGVANYTTYYMIHTLARHDMGEAGSGMAQQFYGITRNNEGQSAFDNMSVRCLGIRDAVGGKLHFSGTCTETDTDGDKVFHTFLGFTHTLVGGTGKYKGISGSGSYTARVLKPTPDGVVAVIVDHKIPWKMP